MGEFHQHPDGHIYVRAEDSIYADSRENFAEDYGSEPPPLPDGADDHIYTQGKRHAFMGNGNIIEGGPVPWPAGDAIIAALPRLLIAQSARREHERKDETEKRQRAMTYADRRVGAYPPLTDLADAIFWERNGDPSKMRAYLSAVASTKAKFPKDKK